MDRLSRLQGKFVHEGSSTSSCRSVGLYSGDDVISFEPSLVSCLADKTQPKQDQPKSVSWNSRLSGWALRNLMLLLSWLLTLAVGLPLRYSSRQNEAVLATCLLFAVWLTTLATQAGVKTSPHLCPCLRTLLSSILNAVLWTSLAMIAYVSAESAITSRSLPVMLDTLQTHATLPELIFGGSRNGRAAAAATTPRRMAAGDIAMSILNAGLVSWSLKLYEYRQQLLSRSGLIVFSVSSLLALANVTLGPLLAFATGLGPAARDLAFAARSVTLALGSPVMVMLGGDAGLNAAMVVVSGIVFQMALGFGAGGWLEARVVAISRLWGGRQHLSPSSSTTAVTDAEAQSPHCQCQQRHDGADELRTVASGVTIGINAAAMGTAYLYEVKSGAAPYSALSMMALGIMTVVFSTIQPLAHWVVK